MISAIRSVIKLFLSNQILIIRLPLKLLPVFISTLISLIKSVFERVQTLEERLTKWSHLHVVSHFQEKKNRRGVLRMTVIVVSGE